MPSEDTAKVKRSKYMKAYYLKHKAKIDEANRLYRVNNPEKHNRSCASSHLKASYGITIDDKEAMLKEQRNRCAVCRTKEPGGNGGWHVDHCHKSGRIRGILCTRCNLLLGKAHDSIKLLRAAIVYLLTT